MPIRVDPQDYAYPKYGALRTSLILLGVIVGSWRIFVALVWAMGWFILH